MKKILTGGIDLGTGKILGVVDGTDVNDAVNKGQLDGIETSLTTYIDGKIEGLGEYVGKLDPASGLPTTGSGAAGAIDKNDWWYIEAAGTLLGVEVSEGDKFHALVNNPDTTDNTATNTDFLIMHNHVEEHRFSITSTSLTADSATRVTHNLGAEFVHITLVDDATNKRVDVEVEYIDANNVDITSAEDITVSGVISL